MTNGGLGHGGGRRGFGGHGRTLDKKTAKNVFLRLGGYILKHKFLFPLAVTLTLFSNQLALLGPSFSGSAIDAIAAPGGVDFEAVGDYIIKMLICYIASAVLSYLLSVLMIQLSQRIIYSMRRQLFEKLTSLPVGYFDTHPTGDIISRISYDIDTVNASLSNDVVQVMTSVYTVIGSMLFMWQISKPLMLVLAVTVPASIIFTRYRAKRVRPLFHERSKKLGELNGYAEEMLSGNDAIRIYDRGKAVRGLFGDHNADAMNAYYNAEYYGAVMGPAVNFINNFSMSLIMILGGILFMLSQNGTFAEGTMFFITLGGIAQFVQYLRKFTGPINEFANILTEFQSALAAAERVFRIIDTEPEPADSSDAADAGDVSGNVDMDNVDFGYSPDKQILFDISLHAKPEQTIAIVGPTGSGKTTIINLLMRFYDVTGGRISLDGADIRNIKRSALRGAYSMVLQDTWLFHGTIYENIIYGREDASPEEVYAAAKAARINTYIERLPDGYNTILSDGGVNISKGQRQLITIARAMLSRSPMLILDEATSNVDSRTEIQIQAALDNLMAHKTCFIIAHRLSTVKNADMIIVIRHGRITECGSHEELLRAGGFYSSLYNSQFE